MSIENKGSMKVLWTFEIKSDESKDFSGADPNTIELKNFKYIAKLSFS